MKAILKTTIIGLAAIFLNNGGVSAHAHLLDIKVLAIASNQSKINLTFSEKLVLQFSTAKVVAADGSVVNLSAVTLSESDPKILVAATKTKLGSGAYFVDWKAVSSDSHKTTGRASFEVKP